MAFKPKSKYRHENEEYISALKGGLKQRQRNKYPVKRKGDIPKGASSIVTVSSAQKLAYESLVELFDMPGHAPYVKYEYVMKTTIREATIKALVKAELLDVYEYEGDKYIRLWRYEPSDQEIMEKGGVGKLVISIGVK
jgi:hypothetical protein